MNPHAPQPHRPKSKLTLRVLKAIAAKSTYDKARYERISTRPRVGTPEWQAKMDENGVRLRKSPGWSAFTRLLNAYRYNATVRGVSLDITKEEAFRLMTRPCHYCGAEPSQVCAPKKLWTFFVYNGLDRVDNSLGYTAQNTVPCCKICNRAKNDLPLAEFMEWIQRLTSFQQNNRTHQDTLDSLRIINRGRTSGPSMNLEQNTD